MNTLIVTSEPTVLNIRAEAVSGMATSYCTASRTTSVTGGLLVEVVMARGEITEQNGDDRGKQRS